MSVWAGDSQGVKHVRLRLPGMAGSTAQLRFEFTQDAIGTCADVRPGPRLRRLGGQRRRPKRQVDHSVIHGRTWRY